MSITYPQSIIDYLDITILFNLRDELQYMFMEKSLIDILYTFLSMTVSFNKCFTFLYRNFDTKIQIYKYLYKNVKQINVTETIQLFNNPHYYIFQVFPHLKEIKHYLLNYIDNMEEIIKNKYNGGELTSTDIYTLKFEVPYHKSFFNIKL